MVTRHEKFENYLHDILEKAGLSMVSVGVYSDDAYGDPQGVFAVPDAADLPPMGIPLTWSVYLGRKVAPSEFKYWAIRAFLDILMWHARANDQSNGEMSFLWEDICDRIAHAWTLDTREK